MIEKAPSSSAQHRSTEDLPAPFPHVMLAPKMTEPAGLATHITLSLESFHAAVEGPLGLAAAELFQESQSDDRVLALFYSKPTKGVFVCACDAAGRTSAWLTKEVMKLCKELAAAKTDGEKDLLIVSDSFMNYREDPISDSYELGATRASRLKKAPSWSDPRLAVLEGLLQKRFFPKLEKLESPQARASLVDPAVRKRAPKARGNAHEKRLAELRAFEAEQAAGRSPKPLTLFPHVTYDGRKVEDTSAGVVLEKADPIALRKVSREIVADKNYAWEWGKRIEGADGATFKTLGGADYIFAKDKNHVYIEKAGGLRILEGVAPQSFRILGFSYASDGERFFSGAQELKNVGKPFTINPCGFLIGKNSVYHYKRRLPLDPGTFEIENLKEKLQETNPFIGKFRLRDKDGRAHFEYESGIFQRIKD